MGVPMALTGPGARAQLQQIVTTIIVASALTP
jgi:hypothetical protein